MGNGEGDAQLARASLGRASAFCMLVRARALACTCVLVRQCASLFVCGRGCPAVGVRCPRRCCRRLRLASCWRRGGGAVRGAPPGSGASPLAMLAHLAPGTAVLLWLWRGCANVVVWLCRGLA